MIAFVSIHPFAFDWLHFSSIYNGTFFRDCFCIYVLLFKYIGVYVFVCIYVSTPRECFLSLSHVILFKNCLVAIHICNAKYTWLLLVWVFHLYFFFSLSLSFSHTLYLCIWVHLCECFFFFVYFGHDNISMHLTIFGGNFMTIFATQITIHSVYYHCELSRIYCWLFSAVFFFILSRPLSLRASFRNFCFFRGIPILH